MKFLSNSSILALSAAATLLGVATFTPAIPAQLLLAPSLDSAPAASVQLAANTGKYKDGSYKGPAYDAYYGLVQVVANISGGRLVSVDVLQFPKHQNTSRAINRRALPWLETSVIKAQGTRVNMISGATLTSRAYLLSLRAALAKAS